MFYYKCLFWCFSINHSSVDNAKHLTSKMSECSFCNNETWAVCDVDTEFTVDKFVGPRVLCYVFLMQRSHYNWFRGILFLFANTEKRKSICFVVLQNSSIYRSRFINVIHILFSHYRRIVHCNGAYKNACSDA